MASTATNKQPLLIDRPLVDVTRVTTQVVGSQTTNTLFVQGGQQPALLVDMDAANSDDTNNGGVIDSVYLVRDTFYATPDFVLNSASSGLQITLTTGTQVLVNDIAQLASGSAPSGIGYYTYTGSPVSLTDSISDIDYTVGTVTGFSFRAVDHIDTNPVTLAFYHTRGTTNPVPASGDYRIVFSKTIPANTSQVDCSDAMPQLATPVVQAGNTNGLGETAPLRNKGIYLEKGDRLYVGVFPANTWSGGLPSQGGIVVTAQGGFF
jgi:hypothetical protein